MGAAAFPQHDAGGAPETAGAGLSPDRGSHRRCRCLDQPAEVHRADKPFFIYFATGAAHAPLHVPKEWIDKFKGQFDQGWDKVREETLAREKKLGVVPADTMLTPRPQEIPAWDTLSPDAKKLYARHQEVFAGFLAHTDYHIGRLLGALAACRTRVTP